MAASPPTEALTKCFGIDRHLDHGMQYAVCSLFFCYSSLFDLIGGTTRSERAMAEVEAGLVEAMAAWYTSIQARRVVFEASPAGHESRLFQKNSTCPWHRIKTHRLQFDVVRIVQGRPEQLPAAFPAWDAQLQHLTMVTLVWFRRRERHSCERLTGKARLTTKHATGRKVMGNTGSQEVDSSSAIGFPATANEDALGSANKPT